MRYTWDKKSLLKTLFNKQAREELSGLYLTYVGLRSLQETHYAARETMAYDSECFITNPFIEDILTNFAHKSHVGELPATKYKEKFTKEQIMGLTASFYGSLDKSFLDIFKQLFAERNTHFRFTCASLFHYFSGHTFHSKAVDETFISADFNQTFDNVLTVIHEYAHAIWYKKHDKLPKEYNGNLFCEVESLFMELIAMDYFEKHYPSLKDDVESARYDFYDCIVKDITVMLNKIAVYAEAKDLNIDFATVNILGLLKHLIRKLELSIFEIRKVLEMPADTLCIYPIGGLIAIELYLIYREDPERAFSLYNQILSIQCKDNNELYEEIKKMGIIPSANIEQYERLLLKR